MGSGGSKPEQQHVFNADAPVRLSQSVLNSLQESPETDSTRAQVLELRVQERVNAELQRIRDAQAKKLESLTASLTTTPPKEGEGLPAEVARDPNSLAAHLSSPFYHDWSKKDPQRAKPVESDRSHDSVQKEVMDLKQKLEQRKKLEKVPDSVEKAKESLVQCLRTNDRRPLDCWQEVEQFKKEVGKLEQAFIQKAGR
ncbi:MICOS complex subunit mic19 [Pseudocercospora fuligena]|uniref:MICOS complex subunit mic19 n=1 Tax=Pseudocercospora fuligena TaxID=685502 RepID=A0A8H6RVP4_9PEZI|nr:MICOS complex subunit mic19 [Pseudocercospora fuligena]